MSTPSAAGPDATATPSATAAADGDAGAASERVERAIRALETARREVPGSRPYDLEIERSRGSQVWEIKVAKREQRPYTVSVSADGKRIERKRRARKRGDDAPKALQAKISLSRALRTADRRADGTLSEAEIDRTSSGAIVWTATFERSGGDETEVIIDARTGRVIRIKHGDD